MVPKLSLPLVTSVIAGLAAGLILHSLVMALVTGVGVYVLLTVLKIGRGE